ncbi:MAG TPA: cytochrome P450, partial [Acidimicrobiales bacterium]
MELEHVPLAEIELSDPELWLAPRDHRERVFRTLRDEAPVQFFEEVEFPPFPKGPGYYALTRYEDVWTASRNPQLFSSGQGT